MLVLASFAVTTARRIQRVEALSATPTWSVDAPRPQPDTVTGWARNQRWLIVPGHHNPSFAWIREAQEAAAEGRWTLRHIDYDASPAGRELHRTSPYRWWLTGVGWLRARLTGESLGCAIERGTLIADPLLWALLLIGGTVGCARRLGPVSASLFALGGGTIFPLAAGFQPGAPDPHALAWVLGLASVLPLLGPARRGGYVAAGVCGGLALWNDAATQMPLLLAVGLGAVVRETLHPPGQAPGAWRAWGWAGALTTLLASLVEFGPHSWSGTPDLIHPVQALAWWGWGEGLTVWARWRRGGRARLTIGTGGLLGASVAAVLVWPVWMATADTLALLPRDFYARELANLPHLGVAPNFGAWLNRAGFGAEKGVTMLPLIGVLAAGIGTLTATRARDRRGSRLSLIVAALLIAGLAGLQLRWWNLFDAMALAAIAVWFAGEQRPDWRSLLGAALLLPGWLVGWPAAVRPATAPEITPEEAQALVERDLAYWLTEHSGEDPPRVFSTPLVAGAIAYYGGGSAIASADPTNEAGLQAATRLASANTAQEIQLLLQSQRVNQVVLPRWDPVLEQLVRRGCGTPPDQPLPRDALVAALMDWDVPPWLRPMDYVIPNNPTLQGFRLQVFAVQAEQAPELALSRLGDFFVQRNQLAEARSLRGSLEAYPRSAVALGAIASIDAALRDVPHLNLTLEKLLPLLSRRAARDLPLDRRVSLAALFARVQRPDLARTQLQAVMAALNSATLRTWNPGSVIDLLAVSRTVGVTLPAGALPAEALALIPPSVRRDFQ